MPGYIIARHSSILSNTGLCQATSSRGTAAFSATPAYAKLHHREAQHHSQQNRPMPSYIIARHSSILSNPGLCQATSSQGAASFSATPAYARLHHREAQQHLRHGSPRWPRGRPKHGPAAKGTGGLLVRKAMPRGEPCWDLRSRNGASRVAAWVAGMQENTDVQPGEL